ncbi:glycoside hydrolase family 2 protein [Armatimonas rosea]|uniref:beta-mannosidase n=1 Tax=Armatimonas rosea TaxID=685828 RepID=A0A7W9W6T5_ARMRO|nr:hypothetical protein [Armatimonas rosea]MBB6049877.1 beta-mannosidase [Armatimonas rosea]
MPQTLSLNGDWSLAWHDDFPQFLTAETAPLRTQLTAHVPEPVHTTLMRHGLLDDPRIGLNSLKARWVEEQFWVYRKVFVTPASLPQPLPSLETRLRRDEGRGVRGVGSPPPFPPTKEALRGREGAGGRDAKVFLTFDLLEYDAVIYLNGQEIGCHANAHRPARFDVTGKLRPEGEENTLVVRLDAGLYAVADKPGADYQTTQLSLLTKNHWMRKGQWQRGWDWQQRLMNVGILGDVRLEYGTFQITQLQVYAIPNPDFSEATVYAQLTINSSEEHAGFVQFSIIEGDESYYEDQLILGKGISTHFLEVTITNPKLWWPIGHGEPFQYTACIFLAIDNENTELLRKVGIRKVEVDQSAHPEEGRHFILKINNKPIFCKGGNWVPPDMLYSTVTPERLEELVDLAVGANFNLLRIWGGGTWAGHDLLELCDKRGILVWHDLLFACAKYPGDYPEWAAEARREVQWGMREFAHHPSLVVWCGNNEIEEGDWNWGYDRQFRTHPHYALFHHDFPQIAKREAPYAFYWISSPYSPDYENPTDPTVGDQHPWGVSLRQNGPTDWWEYRTYVDRFPNEGGVLGASSPATLRQFLPEGQRQLNSPTWDHHDNPYAMQPMTPGQPGRAYQTLTHWTGLHAEQLDWETYAFASALLQAEGLTEYITNYRRRMFSSSAAIFWMYNDSWPTTHSWTIVDYYRRKKLAYHPVRRAFQPVSVVCAPLENPELPPDGVGVFGINETDQEWHGYLMEQIDTVTDCCPCDPRQDSRSVVIPPNSTVLLATLDPHRPWKPGEFAQAVLYDKTYQPVAQHRVFFHCFQELKLAPNPTLVLSLHEGVLTLRSEVFVWGVCLDTDGERPVADNCFDLLPGVPYSLPWDTALLGEPKILRTGNGLFAAG